MPDQLPPPTTQAWLDRQAQDAAMVNEIWIGLTDGLKRDVCNSLARYSGPNLHGELIAKTALAARVKSAMENKPQLMATGKRKRDDDNAIEPAHAWDKKPKVSETTAPTQSANFDIVSPKIPFAWPKFRQSPIIFGQPTLSPAVLGKSPSVTPHSTVTTSAAATNNQSTAPPLRAAPHRVPFTQFAAFQPNKPIQQGSECDEQFSFADRRTSHPQPTAGAGASHQQSFTGGSASSGQSPPASYATSSAGTNGWQPISTLHKAPFAGVDMSSLKIPANSNVSVTMNFFHAPSVLHQNMDNGAPRKLKCIQCKELYMESQNTAMECRRHTGT